MQFCVAGRIYMMEKEKWLNQVVKLKSDIFFSHNIFIDILAPWNTAFYIHITYITKHQIAAFTWHRDVKRVFTIVNKILHQGSAQTGNK